MRIMDGQISLYCQCIIMPSTTIQQNWTAAPLCYKTKPTINHIEFKNSHQQWKKTTTNKQNKLQNEIIKITIMIVIIVF